MGRRYTQTEAPERVCYLLGNQALIRSHTATEDIETDPLKGPGKMAS